MKMTDENWQKVREIFDSALRRKPEERTQTISGGASSTTAFKRFNRRRAV